MRLEFDRKVPLLEQRLRVAAAKKPGRKHQKRKGAKAKEREKASARRHLALVAKKAAKFKSAVAAYWRGERETHPTTPNVFGVERPPARGEVANEVREAARTTR